MAKRGGATRRITGAVARGFLGVTAVLPLPVCRVIGSILGWIGYLLVPRVRRVGLENLARAYGDSITTREKKRILRGAMRNAATVAAEFSHLAKLTGPQLCELVEVRGRERLEGVRGCVLLATHSGNWEWMAPALQAHGLRMAGVVRPLDDPGLNAAVDRLRRLHGVETIDKDAAGSRIFQLLRDGVNVGILIDQSPREGGVPVTFFGAPCWATVAPAMIALRSKAPMVFVGIARCANGRYSIEIHPPLDVARSGDLRQDLVAISQACQDRIEAIVRANPDQWLWLHRRWKVRPRLEAEWQARMARQKKKAGAGSTDDHTGSPDFHS